MSERPIKTVAQIADALDVEYERAEGLLAALEFMGVAERAGSGYRRTLAAERRYAVLSPAEVEWRRIVRRLERRKSGQCIFCGCLYDGRRNGTGFCSPKCEQGLAEMQDQAA